MPLNIFAGAAALLSCCKTHTTIAALPWSWLSFVYVSHRMHLPLFKSDGDKSFNHHAGQLDQIVVAVLQLISLVLGSVEYSSKHGDVCFWQMRVLNQFPGEKSIRWLDVMCTRL